MRVYLLAGQSNMEGKAKNQLFETQAQAAETKAFFEHLRDGEAWLTRDDVFIKYLNRHGNLTLGYGSRDRTGSEYEFGYVLGEHHDDPVLLIKAAWGGHSLYKQFRSPSNPVSDQRLQSEWEQRSERIRKQNEKKGKNEPIPELESIREEYGQSYRKMIQEVRETKENLGTLFPGLKDKRFVLSGVFWFQGWNDQYNGAEVEYEQNMKQFIKDVRKDLDAPELPFVIAVMGQNQSKPAKGAMKVIQEAQLAMPQVAEFQGNVAAVRTDELVDEAAEALYPTWRDHFEQWEKTGSDHAYHYLGSAIWFTRIGRACGERMISLQR